METREDLQFDLDQDKLQTQREAARKMQKTKWLYKIVTKDGSQAD